MLTTGTPFKNLVQWHYDSRSDFMTLHANIVGYVTSEHTVKHLSIKDSRRATNIIFSSGIKNCDSDYIESSGTKCCRSIQGHVGH